VILPAELSFAADGTPFSPAYGDIYHASAGGQAQARHVFLAGNGLPGRWRESARFVILETGFGLGLNFLATLQAWREHPGRRLHYVAVEKHPLRRVDLAGVLARWPELAPLAAELLAQWPPPLAGLHRLDFANATLTLAFGDAAHLLPQLSLAADAIYLDGFAPDRNPELWSDDIVTQLRRLAAPGATLASWTVAGEVRRRLAAAGFATERRPGFADKREMLAASLPVAVSPSPTFIRRRIAVIGAGIAGAAAAQALAARGHEVIVIDKGSQAAIGASGNHAGVFRPLPSLDEGRLARLLQAGFLLGRRRFGALPGVRAGWTGVLHIARDAKHEESQRAIVEAHALPAEYCRHIGREEAAALAGWPVAQGGWWFPAGGWINPPSLCRALLARIECRYGFAVERLEHGSESWRIVGDNATLTADDVVLANGVDAAALVPDYRLPIRPGRGLVSHIPEAATARCDIVATRLGYVTPAVDGMRCAGATMAIDDRDPTPRLADHAENLQRLDMALPGFGAGLDPAALAGRVSFRPMSPDRLPIVGPLAASDGLWIINGFGARGMVFAAICAELLASRMDGEPLPVEDDLARAVDPARFPQRKPRHTRRGL
jgi:tRNA 5-methylaminomethyl-2-thiouridine biosynthesis bifunctional protein